MKPYNEQEFNKLCAEFLGAIEYIPKPWYYFPQYKQHHYFPNRTYPNRFTVSMMRFHSDWNWIMEVVEKIENLGFQFAGRKSTYYVVDENTGGAEIIAITASTKKQAVVEAIWGFLNWYNEIK